MNAERLHAILISLNQEIKKNNPSAKMQDLITNLEQMVNNPNPSYQQNMANSLKAMYAAVSDVPSDNFSPTWRQILHEIGGEQYFGLSLKQNVETIFARNQITPAVALEELRQLFKQIQAFEVALKNGASAFQLFKIGDETLSSGECEIGVLIPRKSINNQLTGFADELKEIEFILNTFAEVATGSRENLTIRTISSSDLLVYINAAIPFAACLAVAIERTVALYKQLLEIRKLHNEIRQQGVPDTDVSGIEKYANKLMENGIEKLSIEIVDQQYKKNDPGRKNELKNAVRISLNKVANRIDQGYNIEVRVQPLAPAEQSAETGAETMKSIELIQKASTNMQFLKLNGQPILKLREVKEEKREPKEKKEKKDKS